MFKKFIISIIAILIFSSINLAVGIYVSEEAVKNTVLPGEDAIFILNITNNQDDSNDFVVSSADLNWILEKNIEITIEKGKTKTVSLQLKQLGKLKPGEYGATVVVQSQTNKGIKVEKILRISVIDEKRMIGVKLIAPDIIDPRRETTVKLQLKNLYDLFLEDIKIKIISDIFEDEKTANLGPKGEQEIELTLKLNPNVEEGIHTVNIISYQKDKVIGSSSSNINIGQYLGVREIITPENFIFIARETVKKINEGNAVVREIYTKELGLFKKLITATNPEPTAILKQNGVYILKWDFTLIPKESKTIYIETRYYIPMIILVALIILIALGYYYGKKDIRVVKKVLTKIKTEHGITKMKILISIRNKKGVSIKNLKVMDRIPHGTKAGDYGTMVPKKVIKGATVLNLIWNIPELGKHEERLISYKVESPLKRMILPSALVKYSVGKRTIVARSNKARIL